MASDNPVPAPTPADLARDLAADLATVEAATAGWDWLEESWTNHGEETLFRFAVFREVDECQVIVCYAPVVSQIGCQDDEASDIHAIAASREAWPAAIRRALHAEAECERLRKLIERDRTGLAEGLARVRQIAGGWSWLGISGEWGCYEYQQHTIATLREEMGRCLAEIETAAYAALRASGDRVTEAFRGPREGDANG